MAPDCVFLLSVQAGNTIAFPISSEVGVHWKVLHPSLPTANPSSQVVSEDFWGSESSNLAISYS